MGNIDQRWRGQGRGGRRHEKWSSFFPEDLDHRHDYFHGNIGDFCDLFNGRRQSAFALSTALLSQALEHLLGDDLLPAREFLECFVYMNRQSLLHAADLLVLVMLEAKRFAILAVVMPTLPGSHQRMLHDGQLSWIVAGIVQQPVDEGPGYFAASNFDRSFDRFAPFIVVHARNQKLATIDRFRKSPEVRTLTEVVGSHRQNHIDMNIGLTGSLQ